MRCNIFVVPHLELHPELQTETDQAYLTGRPIRRYREEDGFQFDSWAPGCEWVDVGREHQSIFREESVARTLARTHQIWQERESLFIANAMIAAERGIPGGTLAKALPGLSFHY